MNKRKNLPILIILIVLLIASFGGLGYYVYKERLNKNNQEIMLNEVKNSIMDRNYKKAHSITKILKDKYPQNTDIAMLENTLSELANNSPFESKDLQRDTANQILDKIQGKEQFIPINNENSEIAFNNRYIKDTTKIENYADRKDDIGIKNEDILEFNQNTVPENLNNNTSKIVKQQESNLNSNKSIENKKNLFNLKKLKENLNKELNQTKTTQLNTPNKITKKHKQNEDKLIEKNTDFKENKKNQIDKVNKIPPTLKPKTKIESTNTKNSPKNQIIEKIERPYSYVTKKVLYEILDNINTGNPSFAKERLNELIKKGLSHKFNKVNDLIDKLKNQEAANLLIKLIKQDIEPNSAGTEKAPFKKELLKQEHPKEKISPIKDQSIDNQIKMEEEPKTYANHSKQESTDLQSLKMLASANEEQKDFKKAEEIYEKIASITNNAEDHYKVGIMKFKLKKYEEAIKAFDKTISLNPKHKKAYTNKGTSLILSNTPKQAIEAFKKAIIIDKNYDNAYYKKGIAEEQNNDKQNAFLSFKKAYEITKNPHYALKAGIMANHIGDFKNSEKYLDKASASIKEKNDIMFYNLAIAKFENNNLNESLKTINQALVINPKKPEYLYLKASIYLTKENYNEAIPLYNAVILKNPDNITAHINLARSYEKSGNEVKAIEILEKISNKNHLLALNNLGILYKNQKNYQKAIKIFQKAEALSSLEAKYNLATTFLALKDNKRAMEKLKEYIKINPNNPEALHALGTIEYNDNGNDKILKEVINKFPNYKQNQTIMKIIGK
ncbi:tetratricopeptide repeat protein [Borrelia hermsii]|uniref:tetratricopeptide repeat protein n=1 Tax=Borrelia hermsii TaxID=140 RepID=UPI0003E31ED4|nr:tetratricopeptide repeat protein [Borrelia hermsii]AHH13707.1 Putative tetratricopeptide repeat domain protein [Borrelia hermsii MTW]